MSEEQQKVKKKVFAEVVAEISLIGERGQADLLAAHFLTRNGIALHGDIARTPLGTFSSQLRVNFTVSYKVHGGWRSDFVKKIESDAADLGVKLNDLEITVNRTEIPHECPRRECIPCAIARGEYEYARSLQESRDAASQSEPEPDVETREPRKIFSLRRR